MLDGQGLHGEAAPLLHDGGLVRPHGGHESICHAAIALALVVDHGLRESDASADIVYGELVLDLEWSSLW